MATANAVTFDGTNDYLTRGADLDGNADSQQWTWAFFFKRNGIGTLQKVFSAGGNDQTIEFRTGNDVRILGKDNSDNIDLSIDSSDTLTDTSNWHSCLGSVNMAVAGSGRLYIDDVSDYNETTFNNDNLEFTKNNHGIGALTDGSSKLNADLALLWIDFGTYVDFDVEANRRIFITSNNQATSAFANSTDGAVGGLSQPIMFFNNPAASWETNLGSGGGFSVTGGALTAATGPEIAAGLPIFRRRREYVGAF